MSKAKPKREVKHKKKYRLNWAQILNRFEEAHKVIEFEGDYNSYLADGISGLRERLGLPFKEPPQ
jgi:hypothetical protein